MWIGCEWYWVDVEGLGMISGDIGARGKLAVETGSRREESSRSTDGYKLLGFRVSSVDWIRGLSPHNGSSDDLDGETVV